MKHPGGRGGGGEGRGGGGIGGSGRGGGTDAAKFLLMVFQTVLQTSGECAAQLKLEI